MCATVMKFALRVVITARTSIYFVFVIVVHREKTAERRRDSKQSQPVMEKEMEEPPNLQYEKEEKQINLTIHR